MRIRFDEELNKLFSSIINLAKMVEISIESAIIALMGRDQDAEKELSLNDEKINEMEKNIENQCIKLLLKQQPMATDLRMITSSLKMTGDMKRIGEHSLYIAGLVSKLPDCKYSKIKELTEMSTQIISMFHDSIDSYIKKDSDRAKNVICHDDEIDRLYHEIKTDLIQQIRKTDQGETILDYLLIAKYIERIGDHTVNIARWVIYALTGKRF